MGENRTSIIKIHTNMALNIYIIVTFKKCNKS